MYPYLKFMNSTEDDDIIFAPLNTYSTLNNGFFTPEEFIEEFRTSSISENPLKFDFRETLLNSNISNDDEDLIELLDHYNNDSEDYRDELKCYDSDDRTYFDSYLSIPTECNVLRNLDLDIDEEVLELEKEFEDSYEFENSYELDSRRPPRPPSPPRPPQKFPPFVPPFIPPIFPPTFPQRCNPEIIFRRIESNNPRIIRTLESYRIPYPVIKRLLKQVITLTLDYCPSCNRGR